MRGSAGTGSSSARRTGCGSDFEVAFLTSATSTARLFLPELGGLPRPFWWLWGATLIDRLGGFAGVYLSIHLAGTVGLGEAGLVLSLFSFGGVIGAPVGGVLADRLGRKPVLVGGMLAGAMSWLHVAVARELVHVGAAVFVAGICTSLSRPALTAAVADIVPEADRRRAYGVQYWGVNIGFALAAAVAGLLASLAWPLVFVLDATSSIIGAIVLWFAMRGVAPLPSTTHERVRPRELFMGPLRDRAFLAVVSVAFLNALMFGQASVVLAADMRADGLVEEYGPLIALNGALVVLLQPALARITSRFRAARVMAAGSLLAGLGFFFTAFADVAWQHASAIAVWTTGEILAFAVVAVVVTQLAPPERRATYQGLFQMAWPLASFAPALGAFVMQRGGSTMLWSACLCVGVIGCAIQMRLDRSPRMG